MSGNNYFVNSSLKMISGAEVLNRRRFPQLAEVFTARIIKEAEAPVYPISEKGELDFNNFYNSFSENRNSKYRFYSPDYKLSSTHTSEGFRLPEVKFVWLAGSVVSGNEDEIIAELHVSFRRSMRRLEPSARVMEHHLAMCFTYNTMDDRNIARNLVSIPFERIVENNSNYTAIMPIRGMDNLTRIVSALNNRECNSALKLTAKHDMHVPSLSYIIDIPLIRNRHFHESLLNNGMLLYKIDHKVINEIEVSPMEAEHVEMNLTEPEPDNTSATIDTSTINMTLFNNITAILANTETIKPKPPANFRFFKPVLHTLTSAPIYRINTLPARKVDTALEKTVVVKNKPDHLALTKSFRETPYLVENIKALPLNKLSNRSGKKSCILKRLSAEKKIPFHFNRMNYGQIYQEIPDNLLDRIFDQRDPAVYIKHSINHNRDLVTIYQDPLQKNLFYFTPTEFKLGRADNPPYEPLIRIGFKEVLLDTGEQDKVTVKYQVELTFTVLPHIDSQLLTAIMSDSSLKQAAGGEEIQLTPLNPESLFLDLQGFQNTYRASIMNQELSFSTGLTITTEMGSDDFNRLFAVMMNDAGIPGIQGLIAAGFEDGSTVTVPVQISLFDTTGPLFSQNWTKHQGDPEGTYRVLLKNEIESPVQVASSRVRVISEASNVNGYMALVDGNFISPPGSSREIKVTIRPVNAYIKSLQIDTDTTVKADIDAIWKLITINQGYSTYTFDIKIVLEEAELLGTSPGNGVPVLTAIRVDFDNGSSVELSEDNRELSITLYKSILSELKNEPMTEQYKYRITNIHGHEEGARGNWETGMGTLHAGPVRPE